MQRNYIFANLPLIEGIRGFSAWGGFWRQVKTYRTRQGQGPMSLGLTSSTYAGHAVHPELAPCLSRERLSLFSVSLTQECLPAKLHIHGTALSVCTLSVCTVAPCYGQRCVSLLFLSDRAPLLNCSSLEVLARVPAFLLFFQLGL